jgi:tetratricopeptide (TPR) repeat protein
LVAALVGCSRSAPIVQETEAAPTYVGRAACAECHAEEAKAWAGSDHDRAMQPATAATVQGDFNNARFTYTTGVTTTFFRKGEEFWVRTDGPDGKLTDYRVSYTFGFRPLEQYLIEFPDGRMQALDIGWDSRPKSEGGQRWFHLHPKDKVDYRDVLHWAGPALNWNHMCAECHSTDLRKNYDAATNRFATKWKEINVSCEACHGPGSRHVAWAKAGSAPSDASKGFEARLGPGTGKFQFVGAGPNARLQGSRDTAAQLETCARCHSRRTQLNEDWHSGHAIAQTHRVSLLDEGLYESDGQIRDEVYEYASFLQSTMHASDVVCSDCHDPHSTRRKAEGNAVCATCHQPAVYDATAHHHHRAGTEGAQCISCHMPARYYMVVDKRRDHGFRVPRPDFSAKFGTPNACNDCHRDRPATWAAAAVVKWYGPSRTRGSVWVQAIAPGRRWDAGADVQLVDTIRSPSTPAIVRATALDVLTHFPEAARLELIESNLRDPDPLVRRAALGLLFTVEPKKRWALGSPLLADPVRTVRLEAVSELAGLPAGLSLAPAERGNFDRAVEEYRAAQALNADRADSWLNLGSLETQLGSTSQAEAAYRRGIRLQPSFMPPYINLADLYRAQGREAESEAVLREAIAREPGTPDPHHALGLLLVRRKQMAEALVELGKAAALAPNAPRYTYVYALGLDRAGQRAKALALLAKAQGRFTGDRDILGALVELSLQAGDREAAVRWAQKLQALGGGPGPGR